MLSFSPCRLLSKETRREIRVLRSTPTGFLVAALSKQKTFIYLCHKDGSSIVVISFNEFCDVLNASLSDDNAFVHITERISHTLTRKICYRSAIYDLQGISRTHEQFYPSPADGFFVLKTATYWLMVFHDNELTMAQISRGGRITRRKTAFSNVLWMDFWNRSLTIVIENRRTYQCAIFTPTGSCTWQSVSSQRVTIHEHAFLPPELCLLPLGEVHLPVYRSSRYRFFLFKVRHRTCFIQQLFRAGEPLAFNVSIVPTTWTETIVIPQVAADVPVCFFQHGELVIGFVSNHFLCVIDVKHKRPFILRLPKSFVLSGCSPCAETVPNRRMVVDIDSGEVYEVAISFQSPEVYSKLIDRNTLIGFACLTQRMHRPDIVADLIHVFEPDYLTLLSFVQSIFSFLPPPPRAIRRPPIPEEFEDVVASIDTEFPAAGCLSRAGFFRAMLGQQRRISAESCDRVLRMLRDQNIIVLKSGLNQWIKKYRPSAFVQAIVRLILDTESVAAECPKIPDLRQEAQSADGVPMSQTVRSRLRECGLFQQRSREDAEDVAYWQFRITGCDWTKCLTDS
jgi:hypothetical protein